MRSQRTGFALLFVFATLLLLTRIASVMWQQTSLFFMTACMCAREERVKRELNNAHRQAAGCIQKGKPIILEALGDAVLTSTLYVRNGTTILQTTIQKGTRIMQMQSLVSKRRHECTFSHVTLSNSA